MSLGKRGPNEKQEPAFDNSSWPTLIISTGRR